MLTDYADIRSRLGEPVWFDHHGVPRYDEFDPRMLGVYDHFAAYVLIKCQDCGRPFHVGVGRKERWVFQPDPPTLPSVENGVASFHYGDPPAHGCIGDTMNSVPIRVLQFWRRDGDVLEDWKRDENHEVEFDEDDPWGFGA